MYFVYFVYFVPVDSSWGGAEAGGDDLCDDLGNGRGGGQGGQKVIEGTNGFKWT